MSPVRGGRAEGTEVCGLDWGAWGVGGELLLALLDCDSGQCPHVDIQPWP